MARTSTRRPTGCAPAGSRAVPHLWKYRDIHPCLLEAARLVPMELSERRSLIMVNPGLAPLIATVTTLFAAYRINVPDEIMPAHRHSPNAIRFGLTGATNSPASKARTSRSGRAIWC